MTRPKLLDLFCGAGGCAMGYHRAGFDVVGVDLSNQPRYPWRFHQADALAFLAEHGSEFDVIHASPPCQAFTAARHCRPENTHLDLIDPTRQLLIKIGKPWVIENVPGSPLVNPIVICGTMFPELRVIRHRLFESSISLDAPGPCNHPPRGSVGAAGRYKGKKPGDWVSLAGRGHRVIGGFAMGIDWMKRDELSQAIPTAYTEWIGRRIMESMRLA